MIEDFRITGHPVLDDLKERKKVKIIVNGKILYAFEGEPIAAALYANGIKVLRHTPQYNEPRGVFCNRGRCTDCIMKVNGRPNVRTCITAVTEGMKIETLHGMGEWSEDE